ncbi:MAG TPA: GNAT family N-acetyltransferase [Ktedonobacterales bacterium]|nr:GNAT family N-acetyltransferase [Ktedonobacterales bacterium]
MTIELRPPAGASDMQRIYDLVQAFPAESFHVVDLPYRLCSPSAQVPENARLWEDEQGRLLGYAIAQQPFWTLDYCVHPAARAEGLEERILAWGLERWPQMMPRSNGRLSLWLDAREDQAERIAVLERLGFARDAWSMRHLSQSLARARSSERSEPKARGAAPGAVQRPSPQALPPPAVPEGFSIRPLTGEAEVEAHVALHRAAFESNNMTVDWRRRTLESPQYIPALDLVAVDADGALAGFCVCWLSQRANDHNGSVAGQVEPMGVRPDLQQRGLGRALLLEGLRRLQAHGATTAYVDCDGENDPAFQLYEAAGFRIAYKVLKYRKDL